MANKHFTPEEAEYKYASNIKIMVDLLKPKNLYIVGGRGVAKTTEILAERVIDVVYDMPRANFAFVADTYTNLLTNIIPKVREGWSRKAFFEGYHYVVDIPPPANWPKPYTPVSEYKHTISFFNGSILFLKSLDRPSINAGISIAHLFGDEVKYLKVQKLNKVLPTLRGDAILLAKSHFFMGQSFCTDMPITAHGEDDWILSMAKRVDKDQVKLMLQAALIVNEINWEIIHAKRRPASEKEIKLLYENLDVWQKRLRKIRTDSSFFYSVSSLANIDILTIDYIKDLLETMDFEEFKASVLSIKSTLLQSERFYYNIGEKNFYFDGYDYGYYDQFGLNDVRSSAEGLKYLNTIKPLELGFDPGNMMSLAIAQEQGDVLRFVKFMYTLVPEFIPDLARKFLAFFKEHKNKTVFLHADRAANQYNKAKEDFVTKLKTAIEWQDDKPTGWHVMITTVGAKNIEHWQEYQLANAMLQGKHPQLPKILIDANECRELKSSLELAPMEKSKGRIQKVKKSEKLPLRRLPMESTNPSDAFKAIICQHKYLKAAKGIKAISVDPKTF